MSDDEPPGEPKRRWRNKQITSPSGARELVTRIKKKNVRKESSRKWLERQVNDPYVQRAIAEGWRARSAFKLMELDEKFAILKRGQRVVDLGAAPGGWAQVAVKKGAGPIVGIDLLPIDPLPGAIFLEMDFLSSEAPAALLKALGGAPDVVLCDMAANTTGHAKTDQIRTGALAEAAADFAMQYLRPGGAFVTKAFQGGLDAALLQRLKLHFASVRHAKPPASRSGSPEVYLVAQGKKAQANK
jgi:23S rRNA (uridine2552-2'-O)-methyltransferase